MRRIVVGLAAITALLSGMVGPATASTASQAATTCPVVQVFGVRGSGETAGGPYNGFGKTVQDVFAHFQTTAETSYLVSVDGTAIDYPAVGVGFGLQYYAQLYRESETAGVAALEAAIRKFNRSCGNQSVILLIGYSQGAQVVGDAFVGIGATQRLNINGIVLIADPRFNGGDPNLPVLNVPGGPGIDFGSYSAKLNGIARQLTGWTAARKWPSQKVISVCASHDPVCNYSTSNLTYCALNATCPHTHYTTWTYQGSTWTQWAAERALEFVFGPLCGPTAPVRSEAIPRGC